MQSTWPLPWCWDLQQRSLVPSFSYSLELLLFISKIDLILCGPVTNNWSIWLNCNKHVQEYLHLAFMYFYFLGVSILITFKAMDTFPSFFLIQNKSRPKFDAMLRIAGFVHVSFRISWLRILHYAYLHMTSIMNLKHMIKPFVK